MHNSHYDKDKISKAQKRLNLKKLNLGNPWHLIAVGFASGLAPKAPGTFGSLAAIPLCAVLLYLPLSVQLIIIALSFIIGCIACSKAEQVMGDHDNGGLVIDEFVGMFIAVIAMPANALSLIIAFILFRFFDILKPFPIGFVDRRVGSGFGVMIDDVIAAIYALILGHIVFEILLRLELQDFIAYFNFYS